MVPVTAIANLHISLVNVSLQFYSLLHMERLILSHNNLASFELLYHVLTFQTNSMYIVSHSQHIKRKSLCPLTPPSASDPVGYSLMNHGSTHIFFVVMSNETAQYEKYMKLCLDFLKKVATGRITNVPPL